MNDELRDKKLNDELSNNELEEVCGGGQKNAVISRIERNQRAMAGVAKRSMAGRAGGYSSSSMMRMQQSSRVRMGRYGY